MRGVPRAMALVMLAVALLSSPRASRADYPSYLILPASPSVGYGIPSDRPRYAYGWFGATPGAVQWRRHFGHYRSYTQWSARR